MNLNFQINLSRDLVLITPVLRPCSKNFAKSLHVSELFTIFALKYPSLRKRRMNIVLRLN